MVELVVRLALVRCQLTRVDSVAHSAVVRCHLTWVHCGRVSSLLGWGRFSSPLDCG